MGVTWINLYILVVGRLIELVDHYSFRVIQFDYRYFFLYLINRYKLLYMLVSCFKIDLHISHLNCSLFFIDNQSHLLIWKHIGSVDKDKGLVIKGFLGHLLQQLQRIYFH